MYIAWRCLCNIAAVAAKSHSPSLHADELPRSQAESQPPQRSDSTDLPENFATASLTPSAAPTTAAAPSAISTGTAVVLPVASVNEVDSPVAVAAVDGEKKKGHRRGRSLTGLIPTLKTKPKRSVSELLPVGTAHATA